MDVTRPLREDDWPRVSPKKKTLPFQQSEVSIHNENKQLLLTNNFPRLGSMTSSVQDRETEPKTSS